MNLIQELTRDEWDLIKEGKNVQAISNVRKRTGRSLLDCKRMVDSAREIYPKGPPHIHRPLTEILEGMIYSLDNMQYHLKANDCNQVDRMRIGLQEQVREALRNIRGYI